MFLCFGVQRLPVRWGRWATLGCLVFCGLSSVARAEDVTSLRVLGNARAEESLVFQTFGVEVGETYQVEKVRQGIRNLYRQGLFRDIRVDAERTPDGIALILHVSENPTLLRVRYDGADKLGEDDFAEVVELVPGSTVTDRAVDRAKHDLVSLYRSKGYLLAEVDADLRGDRRADLTFTIREGKKVQVERVLFTGNEHVQSDVLREVMETKEDRWWRGGDFKEDVFEEDKERIRSRLGQAGYVDARITDVRKTFTEDRERLTLEIAIDEGARYRVGTVTLDHGGVLPENRIRTAILLDEGESFDTVRFDESTTNLYSLFHEQGYIYADIDVERVPRGDAVIDITYTINEREPARIHRILITGNTRTREGVIRRELRASPGDIFKRSRVIRSQREVFQLGFFNDIQLDSRTADRETGAIDLLLNVEERQTGTASLGAGVNSQAGLTGFLQLSQNNFMGRGQIISIRAEFGRFRQYDISFTEPWLFGTPTSAGVDAFDTRRRFTEYEEKRRGVNFRIGRPFPWLDYTRLSTRYSLAEYRIEARSGYTFLDGSLVNESSVSDNRLDDIELETLSTVSSMSVTLLRNSVDSPFFPTRGSSSRLTYELGGTFLGGDEDYQLVGLQTRSHFRTIDKFVLSLSGNVAFLNGLKDSENVPFWKRFRLGGISRYGLRGYDDFDIVPNENAPSTGGRSMLIMTSEVRYPVVQAIQALAFFDVGNTWEAPGETNLTDLQRGAGLGVRVDVPMVGQLGFDYAYGFDRTEREGGPGWEFHFQIGGQSF